MKKIISALLCAVLLLALLPMLPQTASAASITNFNIRLNEPVASYTPDFSVEHNTNVTVYSNVTWQENSPGFSAKLNSSDEFRAGLAYKVEIWLRLADGNYFPVDGYGDLATAITVNGKPISSLKIHERNAQNQIVEVTITCDYDTLQGSNLSQAIITGIPSPVAGQMPIYSFTLGSNAYSFYHTAPVTWWDITADREMDSGDTFVQGHVYQVNIWLSANREKGYTWKVDGSGKPAVNVTLNSWAADKVTTAYEQDPREVIDIRYNFPACPAPHTCAPTLVPQQDPTCELSGFKAYYACSCGKCFEDAAGKKEITDMDGYGILPALGHIETVYQHDPYMHYKICGRLGCGADLPGSRGNHTGGTASCVEQAICTVCGAAYGELDTEHRWGPKHDYKTAAGHAWICADCKTHSTIVPHTPGAEATETTAQKCTVCGYVITPAKNHTHTLTKVEAVSATCTEAGSIEHYTCSGCSDVFSDAEGKNKLSEDTELVIAPLGHTVSEDWAWDETYHWRVCTACEQELIETKLVHEEEPCSCGYVPGQTPTQKPTEQPAATETPDEPEAPVKQGGMDWLVIVLIVLLCSGISVLATVLILKKRGNKA